MTFTLISLIFFNIKNNMESVKTYGKIYIRILTYVIILSKKIYIIYLK